MAREERHKMLTVSNKYKLKRFDDRNNEFTGNIPFGNSFINEDIKEIPNISHEEKVNELIETLRMKQEYMKSQSRLYRFKTSSDFRIKSKETYKNRFQTQKNIIEQQKIQLQEKEKIINELKMGIITEEIRDYQDKTKIEISELFQDCKLKLIGKIPLDYIPTNRQKLLIKTQNAPKIIQELEQRAFDRMKYREMIKERKRILDETKKKMQEEILEQKRCLEEEEKKKHLESLKEKRKEELLKMKTRQVNKEKFLNNLGKATQQYEIKLLKHTFFRWKFEYKWSLYKKTRSEEHYRESILKKSLKILLDIVETKYAFKYDMAYEFNRKLTLKRAFRTLQEFYIDRIRTMQVAEDFYDFTSQNKIFKHWYRYIAKERILTDIKMQQAIHHHRKNLLFQSFFQWKSLPTVLKLEKAREEQKQKWRQKVWEILPDFEPPEI